MSSQSFSPWRILPALTAGGLFGLFLLTSLSFWFSPYLTEEGDLAANALQVERAREGRELLGPYSRYEFHHPGPINFYGQAAAEPLFAWLPSLLARHLAGQLAVNLILIVWILRLLVRAGLAPTWSVAGVVLLAAPVMFLGGGGMFMLASVWGPLVVVYPLVLFVVAAARICDGDREGLPAAAFGATICYHTHLLTIPVLGAVTLLTAGTVWAFRRRLTFSCVGRQRWTVCGSTALILMGGILPLLIEQATGRPGNLTLLWRFARDQERTIHAWSDVLSTLGPAWTDPLVVLLGALPLDWNAPGIALGSMVVLGLVSIAQLRRSQSSWKLILIAVWAALLVTVGVARQVHGELETYLFYYVYGLVGVLYLAAFKEVGDRWLSRFADSPGRTARVGVVIVLAVMAPWLAVHRVAPPAPVDRFADVVGHFGLADTPEIHLARGQGPDDAALWVHLPTYALQFRRAGVSVTVDSASVFLCGEEMRPAPGAGARPILEFTKERPGAAAAGHLALDDCYVVFFR